MENLKDLDQKASDTIKDLVIAVVGSISVCGFPVGGIASEIISFIIPNQKKERIVSFIKQLSKRIDTFDIFFSNNNLCFLFEKSIKYVSETASEDKYKYYVEFILHSIEDKTFEEIQKERLLGILSELNEVEIILLISYGVVHTSASSNAFIFKNMNIIYPSSPLVGTPEENNLEYYFKYQYLQNMVRLGVLQEDKDSDKLINKISEPHYSLTTIGKLLKRFIGGDEYDK